MEKLIMSVVPSANQPNRVFLRIEGEPTKGFLGAVTPKVGFIPFEAGTGEAENAIKAINEGKARVIWGSKNQRQNLYNLALVDPNATSEEQQTQGQGTSAGAGVLQHNA